MLKSDVATLAVQAMSWFILPYSVLHTLLRSWLEVRSTLAVFPVSPVNALLDRHDIRRS